MYRDTIDADTSEQIWKLKFGHKVKLSYKICDMTLRSYYFSKQKLTLGSVVPLAMFLLIVGIFRTQNVTF